MVSFFCFLGYNKLKVLKDKGYIGNLVVFGIKPEDISDLDIVETAYPNAVIETKLDLVELLGVETNLYFTINHKHVVASIETKEIKEGDTIRLAFDMNKCHFFDP